MPSDTNSPVLVAKDLQKSYQMGRSDLKVLRGCGLEVRPGEFVSIMGKSGSGKSTLLHVLGALDAPQTGEVYFEGQEVCRPNTGLAESGRVVFRIARVLQQIIAWVLLAGYLPGLLALLVCAIWFPAVMEHLAKIQVALVIGFCLPFAYLFLMVLRLVSGDLQEHRRIRLRRYAFGFVFQFYHLLPELNVLENVLLPRMTRTWPWEWLTARSAARTDALAILDRVGLSERLNHTPSELSGGERQRVAIARALVHSPRILFADEPTGNLDAEAGANIMSILKGLHAEGQTIVMVTHDPVVAAQADRSLVLEQGRLRSA